MKRITCIIIAVEVVTLLHIKYVIAASADVSDRIPSTQAEQRINKSVIHENLEFSITRTEFIENGTTFIDNNSNLNFTKSEKILCANRGAGTYECDNKEEFFRTVEFVEAGISSLKIVIVNGSLALPDAVTRTLSHLDLQDSLLTELNVDRPDQGIPNLESLLVSGNEHLAFRSLPELGPLPSLTLLRAARGRIDEPLLLLKVFEKAPNLQELDLADTGLTTMQTCAFCSLKDLRFLDLSDNPLDEITFNKDTLYSLQTLTIANSKLKKITVEDDVDSVPSPRTLQEVNLANNSLGALPSHMLHALRPDAALDLRGNSMEPVYCSHHILQQLLPQHGGQVAVQGWTTELLSWSLHDVTHCGWENCPQNCTCSPSDKKVDCSLRDLVDVPAVAPMETYVLDLEGNYIPDITSLHSPVWRNLRTVNMNYNRLASFGGGLVRQPDAPLGSSHPHLQTVSVVGNLITKIMSPDCVFLRNVRFLYISLNKLVSVGAQECGHLRVVFLDASINFIRSLTESDLASYPQLMSLNLSRNAIKALPPPAFTSIAPKLRFLDVSWNLISIQESETFLERPHGVAIRSDLRALFLDNNELKKFSQLASMMAKYLDQLEEFSLHGNAWNCSCLELKQIQNFFRLRHVPGNMRCDNGELVEEELLKIKEVKSCEDYPPSSGPTGDVSSNVMTYLPIIILVLLICSWLFYKQILRGLRSAWLHRPDDDTSWRKYDVFIVHACTKHDFVLGELTPQLERLGYRVLSCEHAIQPGDYIASSIYKAVRESRRMLVVACRDVVRSEWAVREIRRGIDEEYSVSNFKVLALVIEDLTNEGPMCRELQIILDDKRHIKFTDRDYMKRVCDFLGPPNQAPSWTWRERLGSVWQHLPKSASTERFE